MDYDYSRGQQEEMYLHWKKQEEEKKIWFQTPKLRVHLKEGVNTYNSGGEAAEDLQSLGIKTSDSDDKWLERALIANWQSPTWPEQEGDDDPQPSSRCGNATMGTPTQWQDFS